MSYYPEYSPTPDDKWLALAQLLGEFGDDAYLATLATLGYEQYGCGAVGVAIDRTASISPPTYLSRSYWVKLLEGERRERCLEAIDHYDPDTQLVLVIRQRTPDPHRFWITTYLLEWEYHLA
ncbi:MAG: hypothetical protein HC769_22505 [Cyanobacteria bacterium CRU_2_1]|nr:hypothetical protein [Cyanobacteria bacterium RU_5_0]NJR61359.1 hypothetical protein [Cyanobacteria bacterium CRU_2_1]